MFYTKYARWANYSKLVTLDLSNFNTSKVTNMSEMFSGCCNLKWINLSNFNTSKVTRMSYMFYYCEALIKLDLSNFDTSKVFNMDGMFSNISYFIEQPLDLSSFDTSYVASMRYMFENNPYLNKINFGNKFVNTRINTLNQDNSYNGTYMMVHNSGVKPNWANGTWNYGTFIKTP